MSDANIDNIDAQPGIALEQNDRLEGQVQPSPPDEHIVEIHPPVLEDVISDQLQVAIEKTDEIQSEIKRQQSNQSQVEPEDASDSDLLSASTGSLELQPKTEQPPESSTWSSTVNPANKTIKFQDECDSPKTPTSPKLQRSKTIKTRTDGTIEDLTSQKSFLASSKSWIMSPSIQTSRFDEILDEPDSEEEEEIDRINQKIQFRRKYYKGEEDKYNVHDFYFTEGIIQRIARAEAFENFTILIIILQAVYFYFDTEYNLRKSGETERIEFTVLNQCFCAYFLIEIVIRFLAFENKRNCLRDAWFVFDTLLAILIMADRWIIPLIYLMTDEDSKNNSLAQFSALRLFRLARVSRVVRLMAYVPELCIFIDGLWFSLRSIAAVVVLSVFAIFMFGIFFTQMAWAGRNWEVGKENCYFQLDFITTMAEVECDPRFKPLDYYFGSNLQSMRTLYLPKGNIRTIPILLDSDCENGTVMFLMMICFKVIYRWGLLWLVIGLLYQSHKSGLKIFYERQVYGQLEDMYRKLIRLEVEEEWYIENPEKERNSCLVNLWGDIKDFWHRPSTHRSSIEFFMRKVFNKVDDGDGKLSKLEFYEMIKHPIVIKAFELFGIKRAHIRVLEATLFHSKRFGDTARGKSKLKMDTAANAKLNTDAGNEIDFDHFINVIEFLRRGERASVLDVVELTAATKKADIRMRRQLYEMGLMLGVQDVQTSASSSSTTQQLKSHMANVNHMQFIKKRDQMVERASTKVLSLRKKAEGEKLPPGWIKVWSEKYKRNYYWNEELDRSTWIPPDGGD